MARRKKAEQGEKRMWDGIAVPIGDLKQEYQVLRTGSPTLDIALLHGGLVRGGIAKMWGPTGCLKTTICQRMAASALEEEIPVLWIDAETAFIPAIAYANGIPKDDDHFRVWKGNSKATTKLTYEQMTRVINAWLEDRDWAPKGCLIIVDSLSAIVTEKELAGDIEDVSVGVKAKFNATWFPILNPLLEERDSNVVFIQQIRDKIGGMAWGEQTHPGGGRAMEHYPMTEIKVQKGKRASSDPDIPINFTIMKNKYAWGGIKDTIYFRPGYGLDTPRELIELGLKMDLVKKSGQSFSLAGSEVKIAFKEGFRSWLIENPDAADELEAAIIGKARNEIDAEFEGDTDLSDSDDSTEIFAGRGDSE